MLHASRPLGVLKLSGQSVQILLDLIEIKLAHMESDEDDNTSELAKLKRCRDELKVIDAAARAQPREKRRAGRPARPIYEPHPA